MMTDGVPWPPGWVCARAHDWSRWHWPAYGSGNATTIRSGCVCGATLVPEHP